MKIRLNKLKPTAIASTAISDRSIWESEVEIDLQKNNLILAKSGKGKSSFIGYLTGLRTDFEGEIWFDNTNIKTYQTADWIEIRKHKLGIVFQTLDLFPNLTGMENVLLKNELTNFKTEQEVEAMFKCLGIEEQMKQTAKTMSMGQKQRVAIIRALCQPFEGILLDEPFSHLDPLNARKALDLILTETNAQGAGIILTSLDETVAIDHLQVYNL